MLFPIDIVEVQYPEHEAAVMHDGMEKLGGGCFASAYASGTDRVIKVSRGHDWGYMSYLEALQSAAEYSPWMPKIFWVKVFMDPTGDERLSRIVTCMERLERPWPACHYRDVADDEWYQGQYAAWMPHMTMCYEVQRHIENVKEYDWIASNPETMAAVSTVHKAMKMCNRDPDLHLGNFMLRGQNQIVITDPIGF